MYLKLERAPKIPDACVVFVVVVVDVVKDVSEDRERTKNSCCLCCLCFCSPRTPDLIGGCAKCSKPTHHGKVACPPPTGMVFLVALRLQVLNWVVSFFLTGSLSHNPCALLVVFDVTSVGLSSEFRPVVLHMKVGSWQLFAELSG